MRESGGAKIKWEFYESADKDFIVQRANELGWQENKVQVRRVGWRYAVEPFDNCGCPNMLDPSDYVPKGL